ncbi:ser Thr protein phosphatase [Aspergillus sp. HF37]|nr:ser Thr protein phosphatase [Aspergillus sp. HF37]
MAGIRLQILSDLHLESPTAYDVFHVDPKAPFLALLGDVGYVKDDGFFPFLRKQLEIFQIVFLVLGNHEPYASSWAETKASVERFRDDVGDSAGKGEALGKLVLLEQTRYDVSPTLTILGCTLFSHIVPEQAENVSFGLNDFYHTRDWSIEAHTEAHLADLSWLNQEVASISHLEPDRKVIILTHYCPSTDENVVAPRHRGSKLSSGFMTDLSNNLCWQSDIVTLWAFGHTHFNCDFLDSTTGKRVMSNQRGYYFAQSAGFDGEKIVEV